MHSAMQGSSRWARMASSPAARRYGIIAAILVLAFTSLLIFRYPSDSIFRRPASTSTGSVKNTDYYDQYLANQSHPIDALIKQARDIQEEALSRRSEDVPTAASRYRQRRGRHPPPGFDKWMEYALKHNAIIVEDYFDRIYDDLRPFWGLEPAAIAERAATWHHVVRVRDGKAEGVGNTQGLVVWLELWTNLVKEAVKYLPDVDMPINYMDESRLIVPWEDIDALVKKEVATRVILPIEQVETKFTGLEHVDVKGQPYDPKWLGSSDGKFWDLARAGCPPDSPSRHVPALEDTTLPPAFPYDWRPPYSRDGYVRNFTASADPCTQPHMRSMHATFIEPISMSTSKELIPLFGGSKLTVNNEILIPGAMYLTNDPFYSGGSSHGPAWTSKKDGVVWRGAASGGRHKAENWMHFQRHRLIEMLNGTTVSNLERNGARAMTFEMAPLSLYNYARRREGRVGDWLRDHGHAGFGNMLCFPRESNCSYMAPYFESVDELPMSDQYEFKFAPDADGNSFSARFRGLMLSSSLPLKATVYAEWHDARLVPWLHFAPLDNTFQDLHAVLDFFSRDASGDAAARLIAESGKAWAEKVLRREDMLLYVWRLLLEFARVCDAKRDKLGYIADLVTGETGVRPWKD